MLKNTNPRHTKSRQPKRNSNSVLRTRPITTIVNKTKNSPQSTHTTSIRTYFNDPLAPAGSVPRHQRDRTLVGTNEPDFQYLQTQPKSTTTSSSSSSSPSSSPTDLYSRIPGKKPKQQSSSSSTITSPTTEPTTQELQIYESIDGYNTWIGSKMSQPIAQSLQSLFIAHGITPAPKTISTITPQNHIIQTLLDHHIIIPQSKNVTNIVSKSKLEQKQPHLLEFLKTLRLFHLLPQDILAKYKPGYINPNIPFQSGCYNTNHFDQALEQNENDDNDHNNNNKNNIQDNQDKKRITTIIDAMIDCLRLSGAFDVTTINPKTLKTKMNGVLTPPSGEDSTTNFNHIGLIKYHQKKHIDHECTKHSIAWYQQTLKNEFNITTLQKLHAQFYRYDISYAFRLQFDSLYNKVMSFNVEQLIHDNPSLTPTQVVDKFAPTKAELKMFKSLIYDEHLQTRFYQHFIKSTQPTEFISVSNQSYANEFIEKRESIYKDKKYAHGLFSKLQSIATPDEYSFVYNNNTSFDNNEQLQQQQQQSQSLMRKQKLMILPPEENYKLTTIKKLFYLLIQDNVIPLPPKNYNGTIQDWIMDSLVKLRIFRKLEPHEPDAIGLELPQIPNPDNESELVEIDTYEHELLDMLYDIELIQDNNMGRFVPWLQTPLLLKTDSQIQRQIKTELLNALTPLIPIQVRDAKNNTTKTIMKRPIPLAAKVLEVIVVASEKDLDEQIPAIDGLVGNSKHQIASTWPRFIQLDDSDDNEQNIDTADINNNNVENIDINNNNNNNNDAEVTAIPTTTTNTTNNKNKNNEEFIYENEFIQMLPFTRSIENDELLSPEIKTFDTLLVHLDPTTLTSFHSIQSLLTSFYRHDICLTFAQQYPQTFKKLIMPIQSSNGNEKKLLSPTSDDKNEEEIMNFEFTLPTFTSTEVNQIRWLLSNLHLQFHLQQQYSTDQDEFQFKLRRNNGVFDPNTMKKIEFKHVVINNGFTNPDIQNFYFNTVWKGYQASKLQDEDDAKINPVSQEIH